MGEAAMKFPPLDRFHTGVSVPVSALRTRESCGVGEFSDLVQFGRWCRGVGLDLVQLLPVNDTGGNSSPYSALSAFALHPLYLRLQEVPGARRLSRDIERFQTEADAAAAASGGRFLYRRVLDFKLSVVRQIYAADARGINRDKGFQKWHAENPWVVPFSVFTALRAAHNAAPWSEWPSGMALPDPQRIASWWDAHQDDCMPAAWTQYLLETQLSAASHECASLGVHLKGDLPILMSRDSTDVWSERRFFDLDAMAGAPPDMFSPDGQNWGFPVYDWESLARDGLSWWKSRLRQAGKFFHAFRIDHVLGFFRIWRIPRGEVTGLLGMFSPSTGLTADDIRSLGYDSGRVTWLTVPHVSGQELRAALGEDASRVADAYLTRVGTEDLSTLRPEIDTEQAIRTLPEPEQVKSFLLSWHANRTLLDQGAGTLVPAWYLEQKKGFRSLSAQDQAALRELLSRRRQESEADWERRGRELLAALSSATDMLVCAEDLGDVPRCVPRVLEGLGILGLKIVRWARDYDHAPPGAAAEFIPPQRYPRLSVCTPSVHDTSTLRGWWEEDAAEREAYHRTLGAAGPCPPAMTPDLLERIVRHCCGAESMLTVFQLQDLLDLDPALWTPDPRQDRVNVPGTVNDWNWTWRMPLTVEDLSKRDALAATIRDITAARKALAPGAAR
jgi:4-alpha-glucanotransferase